MNGMPTSIFIDRDTYLITVKALLEERWDIDQEHQILLAPNLTQGLLLLETHVGNIETIAVHTSADKSMVQEAIMKLRQQSAAYIIMITPFDNQDDLVEMYNIGANLCLPTNYAPEVTMAYLIANNQYAPNIPASNRMAGIANNNVKKEKRYGDLTIDSVSRNVTRNGMNIHLTAMEFKLLLYLATNADILLTPGRIYENVWGSEDHFNSSLGSRISRLRKKIEVDPRNPKHIITKYGQGYCFRSN